MADSQQDPPRHAGQVVRRVLLRRNIAIDAETAQLVAAAVQAALQAGAPLPAASPGARAFPAPAASRCSDHDRGVTTIPLTAGYSRSRSICQTAA